MLKNTKNALVMVCIFTNISLATSPDGDVNMSPNNSFATGVADTAGVPISSDPAATTSVPPIPQRTAAASQAQQQEATCPDCGQVHGPSSSGTRVILSAWSNFGNIFGAPSLSSILNRLGAASSASTQITLTMPKKDFDELTRLAEIGRQTEFLQSEIMNMFPDNRASNSTTTSTTSTGAASASAQPHGASLMEEVMKLILNTPHTSISAAAAAHAGGGASDAGAAARTASGELNDKEQDPNDK